MAAPSCRFIHGHDEGERAEEGEEDVEDEGEEEEAKRKTMHPARNSPQYRLNARKAMSSDEANSSATAAVLSTQMKATVSTAPFSCCLALPMSAPKVCTSPSLEYVVTAAKRETSWMTEPVTSTDTRKAALASRRTR
jgi:hypothetical protein